MKLDKVIRFSKTDIFACQEKIKFTSSPALQNLYCSCFYVVLSFVCVKFLVNYRKFLDICHSLFFLFCCLFSVYCRNLITTALLAKISQKRGRESSGDLAKEFGSNMLHSVQSALPPVDSDTLVAFWTTALYASLVCVRFQYICTVNQNATLYNAFRCPLCH